MSVSYLKVCPCEIFIIQLLVVKVTSVVSEGDVGEDGVSKEEREKQRKRKAADRLREINKRKKIEKVKHLLWILRHSCPNCKLSVCNFNHQLKPILAKIINIHPQQQIIIHNKVQIEIHICD